MGSEEAKPDEKRDPTEYVVLEAVEHQDGVLFQRLNAHPTASTSKAAAIKKAVAAKYENATMPTDGIYIAIPVRSWQPVQMKIEPSVIEKLEPVTL